MRSGHNAVESDEKQHAKMLAMVQKWSSRLDVRRAPSSHSKVPSPASHVVVRFHFSNMNICISYAFRRYSLAPQAL